MLPSPPMLKAIRASAPIITILFVLLAAIDGRPAQAGTPPQAINVVVTIPVLKDLAEQVGGAHVRVTSLLNGYENEHTYSPKPSDLVAVRKAAVLFEVGIGLEVWVSSLVKNAGSPALMVVTTSQGIGLLRDHTDHGPAPEDTHDHGSGGNPHVWMDPENVAIMLRHVTEALIKLDPAHASEFRSNQAGYLRQLDRLRKDLNERLAQLRDRRFIAHHPAWPYLARRFGFEIAATIQAQSGTEPSALHLQSLITTIKKDRIKVIVSEIQLNQRVPELLAKETKARVVVLTTLPGGLPGTETYLDMLRYNVLQLANALEAS
ncbi:MAG: metal ABC transporter substrate-binding protein [Nitrospira sp.]